MESDACKTEGSGHGRFFLSSNWQIAALLAWLNVLVGASLSWSIRRLVARAWAKGGNCQEGLNSFKL